MGLIAGNFLTENQSGSDTSAGMAAQGTNTTVSWETAFSTTNPSLKMVATAAGSVQCKTGFGLAADVPADVDITCRTYIRAFGTWDVNFFINWIDAAGQTILQTNKGGTGTTLGSPNFDKWEAIVHSPIGTVDAQFIIIVNQMAAGEECWVDDRYFGIPPTTAPYAGLDQIVESGQEFTLIGTPPGGVWTQDSGPAVTLGAPVSTTTDTRVKATHKNTGTVNTDLVFRYTK